QVLCANNQASNGSGAGGGGFSSHWSKPPYQPPVSPNRAVPDLSYPSDPQKSSVVVYFAGRWGGVGGTSVASPTNAGLFADTNQGCFGSLGMVAPNLYANGIGSNFTDITAGNNDFTDSHGG